MKGRDVLLEVLATEGVTHIFGNPGTTELPLMDALASSPLEYVLVLHEGVAIGMADGYAQATGRPAFVNLHTAPGLGNALGVLANVRVTGTPIVVTAGQQHRGHLLSEPFLSGNLVDMARPLTKWAYEVHSLHDLGPAMRRAFNDAQHPPTGPVFVSIPMDVLDEDGDVHVPPRSRIERRTVPADLTSVVDLIAGTQPGRFAVVAGDEVAASDGVQALVAVSEALGCQVFGTPMHSRTVFPIDHPFWAGALPADAILMREALSSFDTVMLIGGRGFMTFVYRPVSPLPPGMALIHLSPAASDLGRTYPATLGVIGDPRATLAALATEIGSRSAAAGNATEERIAGGRSAAPDPGIDRGEAGARLTAERAVPAVVGALPPGIPVVDEAVTADPLIRSALRTKPPGGFFYSRGGGLGWGIPAGLGISLAQGRQPVVCLVGDGSAIYGIQALWTAARQRLPVLIVVLNNRRYLILQRFLQDIGGAAARTGRFVGTEITDPPVDFVAVARGFGVEATRVESEEEIPEAVRSGLSAGAPVLLDVVLDEVS